MVAAIYTMLLISCSRDHYLNAIPEESVAVVSIDMPQLAEKIKGVDANILKTLFHVSDASDCGIDITSKIYLFESPEGNFGMVAKVKDENDLSNWLGNLANRGICRKLQSRRGKHFTVLDKSWVVGFNEDAFLVMGPAVDVAQAELMRLMMKYLDADEGIQGTPLGDSLERIGTPIAMAAQIQALPEQLTAPFTWGAPQNADLQNILISAEMNLENGCLFIDGETFSYDEKINMTLKEASKVFRPIGERYIRKIPKDTYLSILMNVDGKKFYPLLKQNKELSLLLTGVSAAINMDEILQSVDGDMAFVYNDFGADKADIAVGAELGNSDFMDDVDEWKQSPPNGVQFLEWKHGGMKQKNHKAYHLSGTTNIYFGVLPGSPSLFYSGTDEQTALGFMGYNMAMPSFSEAMQEKIVGKRLCMIMNLADTDNKMMQTAISLLKPLLGDVNYMVYSMKEPVNE